ncbi:hypothetical protein HDU86_004014 [Geranomyces michiganensis]|nr:hypothetical protein HDU86_004014 [Geranomyces michiganensis]
MPRCSFAIPAIPFAEQPVAAHGVEMPWDTVQVAYASGYYYDHSYQNCCSSSSPSPSPSLNAYSRFPIEYTPLRNDPLWGCCHETGDTRESECLPRAISPDHDPPPFMDTSPPSARLSPEEVDGSITYTPDVADDGTPMPPQELLEALFVPLAAGLGNSTTAGNTNIPDTRPTDAHECDSQQLAILANCLPTPKTTSTSDIVVSHAHAEGSIESSSTSATRQVPIIPHPRTESHKIDLPWQSRNASDKRTVGFRLPVPGYLSDSSLCSPDSMSAADSDSDESILTPPHPTPPPSHAVRKKSTTAPTHQDKVTVTIKSACTGDRSTALNVIGNAVNELAAVLDGAYGLDVMQINKDILATIDKKLAARSAATGSDGPATDDDGGDHAYAADSSGSEYRGSSAKRSSAPLRKRARKTRRATISKKTKVKTTTTATTPTRQRPQRQRQQRPGSSSSITPTTSTTTPSSSSPATSSPPAMLMTIPSPHPSTAVAAAAQNTKRLDTPTPQKIPGRKKQTYHAFFSSDDDDDDDQGDNQVGFGSPCASRGRRCQETSMKY